MSISKLTAQASNPFWVRKKCHLPISLTSEVGRRCVDRESSNFKPIEASSEESNFEDITNFIEALNDKTALSIVDYFLICAYSAQSLYGINLAFNSKVYPKADSLSLKGTSLTSVRRNSRVKKVYDVLHEDLRIGVVAKKLGYVSSDKFGTIKEGVYAPVGSPNTVHETVKMVKDFVDFIIYGVGAESDDSADGSVMSYWATATILKLLQISGGEVARYASASNFQSFIPDPKETKSPPVIAWNVLVKIIATVIGVAGLAARIIKKKKRKKRKNVTSNFVIIFKKKSFKVYYGDFTLKNYETYKKEVQELFEKGDEFAFGIKEDLPIVGITKNGDLPIEAVPAIYAGKIADNKISIKDMLVRAEPRYIDYRL